MRNFLLRAVPLAGVLCLAAVGFAGSAGAVTVRPAATNACSTACEDISFQATGRHELLKDHSGLTTVNNVQAVTNASNGLESEDYSYQDLGPLVPIYCSANLNQVPGSPFTANECAQLIQNGYASTDAYELTYNPDNGGTQDMCVGDWNNQAPIPTGWKVRLEPCGVSPATILIGATSIHGANAPTGDVFIISGASNNFSTPLVMTVRATAAWQSPTWSQFVRNGSGGIDTQIARPRPGPYHS